MKHRISLSTALAVLVLAGALAPAARADGNFNVLIGQSKRDTAFDANTDRIQEQDSLGVVMDWGPADWPVNFALDIISSTKDKDGDSFSPRLDGSVLEVDAGVRYYFIKDQPLRPYLAGGLSYVSAKVETDDVDFAFDDSAVGFWADGGLIWRIGERFNLGGDVRYTKAEVDVSNIQNTRNVEAGGVTYGVLLGFGW